MKNLICFDFVSNRKIVLFSSIFLGILTIYGFLKNQVQAYMTLPACIYLSMILMGSSYIKDCKANFQKYLFSMPLGRKEYILSKLIYPLCFGIFSSGILCISLGKGNNFSMGQLALIFLGIIILFLLLGAIQLIFLVKFGAERGRIIQGIIFILFFICVNFLKKNSSLFTNFQVQLNEFSWILILLASLLLTYLFVKDSIGAMEKKEY